jgi:4-aminobutyrate--pyruvate transaminase
MADSDAASGLELRDRAALLHPFTDLAALRREGATIIVSGEGVTVTDSEGRRYLEGMGGLWCTALGYGNREMEDAAREQIGLLSYGHLFAGKGHDGAIRLAEKLKAISPAPAAKIFFTASGSEANDTQIKLAWLHANLTGRPGRKKIVSRHRAYHGVTLGATSLTGLSNNHRLFDAPLPGFLHAACPHHYRGAEPGETEDAFSARLGAELEAMILREGPETIAAFIAEPVMGAGGVIVPPRGYFDHVQTVLARYGIAFIADEVITGFGRLGTAFGSDAMGIAPSSISMAKALTSAYAPLGAVTVPPDVAGAIDAEADRMGQVFHGFTYGGHPLSAALALKALEIYERDDIYGHAARIATGFQARLAALDDHPLVGEARGAGLMGGLELVADKRSKRPFPPEARVGLLAARLIQDEGLILRALGDTIAICPPLVISEDEVGDLFERLKRGLQRAEEVVWRERLRET